MNNFYLLLFFTVVPISSTFSAGPAAVITPLEAIKKVLPSEIIVRPKLSLKENMTTILADLEFYAQTTTALPDSNNLTPGWTALNDRTLIETLVTYKDAFLPDSKKAIQDFLSTRMKVALLERPADLWEHFPVISNLFSEQTFWLSFYESALSQLQINWKNISNHDWIISTLLPTLIQSKAGPSTTWNKEFLLNWLGFLKYQWSRLQASAPTLDPKAFLMTLELTDKLMELSDSRLQTMAAADANEIQKQYIEFLQTLTHEIPNSVLLGVLTPGPAFKSTLLEAMTLGSFIESVQERKIQLTLENPRVKSFFALHDRLTAWLSRNNSNLTETVRYRQALVTAFYLRTLIGLRITLSHDSGIISKGAWISDQQFQKAFELFWYDKLLKAQTEALRVTHLTLYNLSLIDKCYRENLQTPTCQGWRETFPLQLKTLTDDTGTQRKVWQLISKTPVQIPPGQLLFAPNEEVHIIAPEIHFHLLTRLSIPSGKIHIQTNKLTYPWIDTSGATLPRGVITAGFPGQKPWIKNSKLCAPRDYLEGVTFMNIPHKNQVNWAGFSVKNPFPKNILVCASHAQAESKDIVGDLHQVLDLGLPPESTENLVPTAGSPGGQISIEFTANNDKALLSAPLLLSMGGDGSSGRDGLSSPLCHQGQYRSFKVGLSHHKEWFQRWLNEQTVNSALSLVSKDQFGDHWYGLFEINLPRTSGSDGGDAGPGGQILLKGDFSRKETRPTRWFLSAGVPGRSGQAGSCGPNAVADGKPGVAADSGTVHFLKD